MRVSLYLCYHHHSRRPCLPFSGGCSSFPVVSPFHVALHLTSHRTAHGILGNSDQITTCPVPKLLLLPCTMCRIHPNFVTLAERPHLILAVTPPSPPLQPHWLPLSSPSTQAPSLCRASSRSFLTPPPPPRRPLSLCLAAVCTYFSSGNVTSSEHPFLATECQNGPSPIHRLSHVTCDSTGLSLCAWHLAQGLASSRKQVQVQV